MNKRKRKGGNNVRDATGGASPGVGAGNGSLVGWFLGGGAGGSLCIPGYTRLDQNPEVIAGVNKLASLIGSMTIHLMANSEGGDVRIKNALSRKVDIAPNRYMTRMTLISWILRTLFLEGRGNAVVYPMTEAGLLGDLVPIPAYRVSFRPNGDYGYEVLIDGIAYDPGGLLHFVLNPAPDRPWMGAGLQVALRDVVDNLAQAAATKKGFMADKWKPSIVVQVDSSAEELATPDGRRELAEKYLGDTEAGTPWIIPAELMKVDQIKPLSLNDLAINDAVTIDKKTVAALLDVPPFVVGAGEFKRDEWNAFINNRILPIVRGLEQELTRKLLISDGMFFRMNPRSLYAYDIKTLADMASAMYVRGMMTGNEARDLIGYGPKEGLDQLVILENFIPADMIGDQAKLKDTTSE